VPGRFRAPGGGLAGRRAKPGRRGAFRQGEAAFAIMSAMPNRPHLPSQASLFDAEPGAGPATAAGIPDPGQAPVEAPGDPAPDADAGADGVDAAAPPAP